MPQSTTIVVQAVSLSMPTFLGIPYFRGMNITTSLEYWDELCGDYHLSSTEKRVKILRYMDLIIKEKVKFMPEYFADEGEEYDEAVFY